MTSKDLAIYMPHNFMAWHPSVRLRRLNMRRPLRDLGVRADIIYRFEDLFPFKNVLISHFEEATVREVIQLRKMGKKLFYDHTENMWGYPYQEEVFNLCDYIVCCSTKLAELTQDRLTSAFTKCVVIRDMVEDPCPMHTPAQTDTLQIGWVGMGGNAYLARDLQPIIEELGMQLVIISEHADADIAWKRDTYLYNMSDCFDIAICPQNVELQPAKSNVKVVTAMGVGLPVICSPNPAYKEIVEHSKNGLIATTDEEWKEAFISLQSLEMRKKFSKEGRKTAEAFRPHAIAGEWSSLLSTKRESAALINNTLKTKYLSYGDSILDSLRLSGFEVEEFRYEDIKSLPSGFDAYLFVENRYEAEDISNVYPRILVTGEEQDLNTLPQFDAIVTTNENLAINWKNRGFVNIMHSVLPTNRQQFDEIFEFSRKDFIEERKKHNEKLHSDHIDAFYSLQQPEARWSGSERDKLHIRFTENHLTLPFCKVLDIGSADGWLALKLAVGGFVPRTTGFTGDEIGVSALEFVKRGMDWTKKHAERLNVKIDLRYGFIEDVDTVFEGEKFNLILAYEILEHLDYLKLPWYLEKIESLLYTEGKVLISLPMQDLHDNPEHLWSPSRKLIESVFGNKRNVKIEWVDIADHEIPGNWFISYSKS